MGSRLLSLGLLLLTSQSALAQEPTSNVSTTPTSGPPATVTQPPCCFYLPMNVGLNAWWTSSLSVTVATVITQYLQYDDTIIPNTTTIYNENATKNLSITETLISGPQVYSRTFTDFSTVVSTGITTDFWGGVTMTYPTPYVEINMFLYVPGATGTDSAGEPTCTPATITNVQGEFRYLSQPYAFAPTPATTWSDRANDVIAPTDFLNAWVSQTPSVTDEIGPWVTTCSPIEGSGEPSIHVPVTALTEHATTTIRMDGAGGGGQPEPSQTPPTSTPPLTPEPVTTPTDTPNPNPGNPGPTPSPSPSPNPGNPNPGNPNPGNPNPGNPNPGNPNPGNPNPGNPNPAPTLPGPTIPIPIIPAPSPNPNTPNNPATPNPNTGNPVIPPGIVLPGPDGNTLAPGATTTISGVEIGVPTDTPTDIILPGGETIAPGVTTTISGTEIVVPTDAPNSIVIDGTTVAAPTQWVVVDGTTVPVMNTATSTEGADSTSAYEVPTETSGTAPTETTPPPDEATGAASRMEMLVPGWGLWAVGGVLAAAL